MKLGKPAKIIVGLLTLWPLLYIFVFFAFMFTMVFTIPHQTTGQGVPAPFVVIFALHLFTIFFMFGLVAFYIYYLFKTDRVPQDKKALWAVVLFLGNMIAMPVFWYLYIWREPEAQYEDIADAFPDTDNINESDE